MLSERNASESQICGTKPCILLSTKGNMWYYFFIRLKGEENCGQGIVPGEGTCADTYDLRRKTYAGDKRQEVSFSL